MSIYIRKRLLLGIPTILGVVTVVFLLLRVAPGDVAGVILQESNISEADIERVRKELGLDAPLWAQYGKYIWSLAQGNLGYSLVSGKPVASQVLLAVRATAELALLAIVFSTVIGVALGIVTAMYRGSAVDVALRGVTLLGLAVPVFWIATIVLLIPAMWFGYLPPLSYVSPATDPWGNLRQFAVPALVLSLHLTPQVLKLVRASMLEVLSQGFVTVAHSKGLSRETVVWRHVLRNSLIPAVSFLGVIFAHLMGGAVVTEVVFNLGGIGSLVLKGIQQKDYQIVQGAFLFIGASFVVVNLLVDLSYGWLDPRIRA